MPSRRGNTRRAGASANLFVDSGAWIALRSRRDQHHAAADGLFREAIAAGRPLVTSNLVLAEVHRLTLFRAGVEPALRLLDRIDASSGTTVVMATRSDHDAARSWLERLAPHPVTYTDAVSFALMTRRGCREVLGFDGDFALAGFDLWHGNDSKR